MANPIVEEIQKMGETWSEYREKNDQRLEELAKGNDVRAKELEVQLSKMDKVLTEASGTIKQLQTEHENYKNRIEMLEAITDRPKGTPQEQLEQKYLKTFLDGVRTNFEDNETLNELQKIQKQAREFKDVTIGTNLAGGFALPKEIGGLVDSLILNFSEIVSNV